MTETRTRSSGGSSARADSARKVNDPAPRTRRVKRRSPPALKWGGGTAAAGLPVSATEGLICTVGRGGVTVVVAAAGLGLTMIRGGSRRGGLMIGSGVSL